MYVLRLGETTWLIYPQVETMISYDAISLPANCIGNEQKQKHFINNLPQLKMKRVRESMYVGRTNFAENLMLISNNLYPKCTRTFPEEHKPGGTGAS